MQSLDKLSGKVIWITGASSGIGESLAYRSALAGAKLVISGTNEKALQDVKSKCLTLMHDSSPDRVLILSFNIKDTACHAAQVGKAVNHFGRIDILVNNAGRSQRAMFHEVDIAVDQEMFLINVIGLISLSRLVLQHWYQSKAKGHFVVTSSTLGKFGILNGSTYAATKHALHGYFECIRNEGYEKGVSVTMICPGPTFSRAADRAFTSVIDQSFDANHSQEMRRMKTDRCSQLMMSAIVNQLDEVWICIQPILLMYYITQYAPTFGRWLIPRFMTRDRVNRLREGK